MIHMEFAHTGNPRCLEGGIIVPTSREAVSYLLRSFMLDFRSFLCQICNRQSTSCVANASTSSLARLLSDGSWKKKGGHDSVSDRNATCRSALHSQQSRGVPQGTWSPATRHDTPLPFRMNASLMYQGAEPSLGWSGYWPPTARSTLYRLVLGHGPPPVCAIIQSL